VTHNTKAFCDEKRSDDDVSFKERLAPDLQSLVASNGMTFGAVFGRVLNDIERSVVTEAEVERGDAVVARTRLKDDVIEELTSEGTIAKLLAQRTSLDEVTSGGAFAKALEQQKKLEEMVAGGAFAKARSNNRRSSRRWPRAAASAGCSKNKRSSSRC
jgi:hypothetical protein